jgi:uncharacterized membrane protein
MTSSSKKHRIIFIDLMRAFAVLQMVQGHTVDALLSNDYRNLDSPFFALWFFMRGMTAPIFLFTAGTVFTYLFRLVNEPFGFNQRVSKGFKRVLLLVALGYLLRYPTPTVVDFSEVTREGWKIFFSVDVLQLIGFGLLFLLISAFIAEKLKLNDYLVFGAGASIFFLLSPFTQQINWINYFPEFIAAYFYTGTGSLFPLFPWVGYVILGGLLGSYLAHNPLVFKTAKFSLSLLALGSLFLILSFLLYLIPTLLEGGKYLWMYDYNIILLRVGIVLILNSIVSYISLEMETIPKILILVGRNTLLIYIVHLMILYGSAWNPGLSQLFAYSLNVWKTIGTALLMILLMTAMVIIIHRLKIKNKELVV